MDGPTVALNHELTSAEHFPGSGNFHLRHINKRRRIIDKRPRVNGDSRFAGWPAEQSQQFISATTSDQVETPSMEMQYNDLEPCNTVSNIDKVDPNSSFASNLPIVDNTVTQSTVPLLSVTASSSALSSPPSQSQAQWSTATAYTDTTPIDYTDVSSYQPQPYFLGDASSVPSFTDPWQSSAVQTSAYDMISTAIPQAVAHDDDFYRRLSQNQQENLPYIEEPQPHAMRYASPLPPQYSSVSGSYESSTSVDVRDSFTADPGYNDTRLNHLQNLENISDQLIQFMAKYSLTQLQDMIKDGNTEDYQTFVTIKELFHETRKSFTSNGNLINASDMLTFEPQQKEILRKANIATFITAILCAHDVAFYHLNQSFLETFVPTGHRLLKWQGIVYLELKTQTYISALYNRERSSQDLLDKLFPHDLEAQILQRHADSPNLSPSEQDFLDRARARRQYLLAETSVGDASTNLHKRYPWIDFAREFATAISKNLDSILNISNKLLQPNSITRKRSGSAHVFGSISRSTNSAPYPTRTNSLGTHSTSSNIEPKRTLSTGSAVRQPWTKPEEQALLEGLNRVNGPHWSQILALYGRGGSINEILKDRNQVQLKDKARNLKLWHLKTGREVPVSLRGVTGELRKRGGAKARAALEAAEIQQSAAQKKYHVDDDTLPDDQMMG